MKIFMSAGRTSMENHLRGVPFSPDVDRAEAGMTLGGLAGRFRWRMGFSGGYMTGAGLYAGGEAAVSMGDRAGMYQTLMIARRIRTPTPEELYQPDLDMLPDGTGMRTSGTADLEPETSDEISLGLGFGGSANMDLFARFERDRIVLEGADPARYASAGSDDVIGIRGSLGGSGSLGLAGFGYGWNLSGYWFGDRAEITPGVPRYEAKAGIWLRRPSFKKTELFILRMDGSETGERFFHGEELGGYALLDLSVSLSIIGAVAKFEVLNVLDQKYETFPGMYMPGRHYRFGLNWLLFD
jgi:hypothetical protein